MSAPAPLNPAAPARWHASRELILLAIIAAIALAVGVRAPVFLTLGNALDIGNDSAILAILVMGQMLVLLTRCIDLSEIGRAHV